MVGPIRKDRQRYLDITRKQVKESLKEAMRRGEIIGKKQGDKVKVSFPIIELPRIRYGKGDGGGIGQGEGQEGDVIGQEQGEGGIGEAGDQPGDHAYEEFSLEELAEMLAEELELPNIEPKNQSVITTTSDKLKTINKTGPEGRRHKRRTYRKALKRAIALREPGHKVIIPNPRIQPIRRNIHPARKDRLYRNFKEDFVPDLRAVIIYMMDVSGSMGEEQKEIARIFSWWIELWLETQYPQQLQSRYIIHDAAAKEVNKDTFYHTRESGGTMVSTAYSLAGRIIEADYNPDEWNIYVLHFSDGDNWSSDDTTLTMKIIDEMLLPKVNMIGYGQIRSPYGSGQLIKDFEQYYDLENREDSKFLVTEIANREAIMPGIKDLFGKGR